MLNVLRLLAVATIWIFENLLSTKVIFVFSCIFILLSRESDQCALRARLRVARHLPTTPR